VQWQHDRIENNQTPNSMIKLDFTDSFPSPGWRSLLPALLFWLAGCAGLQNNTVGEWPAGLPGADIFVEVYERDARNQEHQSLERYLYWVRGFYEGTPLYPRGWNDISADIVAASNDPESARELERKLFTLGRDIAAEWSKSRNVNRVKTGHLGVWGAAAERSVAEQNIDETLQKITDDLQGLLNQDLLAGDITAGRYHPQEPDDWFAF
jgi:hypothetical protein